MLRQPRIFIFCVLFLSFLSGCVSVKLAGPKSEKAKGLEFAAPAKPFQAHDSSTADLSWISSATGNTIAVISDCAQQTDFPLASLESDALSAMTNTKIISHQERLYNARSAIFTEAEGLIDGVPMHMSLITFQKNGCDFSVSYFGRRQFRSTELSAFEEFSRRFKAP